jgi:hypothetical protein
MSILPRSTNFATRTSLYEQRFKHSAPSHNPMRLLSIAHRLHRPVCLPPLSARVWHRHCFARTRHQLSNTSSRNARRPAIRTRSRYRYSLVSRSGFTDSKSWSVA